MSVTRRLFLTLLAGLGWAGCQTAQKTAKTQKTQTEKSVADKTSEESGEIRQVSSTSRQSYVVRLETTKGDVLIEVHPEWAPRGSRRFRELVECGYYDGCKFFRVIDGFMAQVGMNGDPAQSAQWDKKKLRDDPVIQSNKLGFVTFATSGLDSRTTQFFINTADNTALDSQGFAPIGKVIEGMEHVKEFYSGYGEQPNQDRIRRRGNEYLEKEFPELDAINQATIDA